MNALKAIGEDHSLERRRTVSHSRVLCPQSQALCYQLCPTLGCLAMPPGTRFWPAHPALATGSLGQNAQRAAILGWS